jgi:hypothetical protein
VTIEGLHGPIEAAVTTDEPAARWLSDTIASVLPAIASPKRRVTGLMRAKK